MVCFAAIAAARRLSSSWRISSVDSVDKPCASASQASSSLRRSSLSASSSRFWSGSRSGGGEDVDDMTSSRWDKTERCKTATTIPVRSARSEEHTSELQSRQYLVCRLLLEKKKKKNLKT